MNLLSRAINNTIAPFSPKKALAREIDAKKYEALSNMPTFGSYAPKNKGADQMGRWLRRWLPGIGSADSDLPEGERQTLIGRARDAYRNDPIGRAAVTRPRTHVVGTGLKRKSDVDGKALGLTEEQVIELNGIIDRSFTNWARDPRECDLAAKLNFAQQQSVAFASTYVSGDVFALTPWLKRPGTVFGFKVQLIETDRVSNPVGRVNSKLLKDGIEFDKHGAERVIHISKSHPGDPTVVVEGHSKHQVFGNSLGRRRVMHVFCDIDRPEQSRSAPFIAPIIEPLRKIGILSDNELSASAFQSLMTVFIEHDPEQEDELTDNTEKPWDSENTDEEEAADPNAAPDELKLGDAAVIDLEPGAKANMVAPTRPNGAFEPFWDAFVKIMGAAIGIPKEELILYYSSSYSAARAAMLQAWELYLTRRSWFVAMFCQPISEAWFDEAVARGIIPVTNYADPARRAAYTRAAWIGPKRGSIDELKEANAQKQYLANKTTNLEIETMKTNGMDYETVHAGIVRTTRMQQKDGIFALPEPDKPATQPDNDGKDKDIDKDDDEVDETEKTEEDENQ